MAKQAVTSTQLRPPTAPFSSAITIEARGRLVFVSGMVARRADGTIAGVGDLAEQTRQVCENIKSALEAAGGSMADLCRVDNYVRDIEQRELINHVQRQYFPDPPPASTLVEVSKLVSPELLIETSAIAVIPEH
ncbi:MAG TPA: RidA family protein [Candidatus Binataceae bacterium]|nr:RidA family protein [Candidatus Binataceae bacterium]